MKPLKDRFEAKFQRSEGCWNWTGALGGGAGSGRYGHIKHQGKCIAAHRISFELYKGAIPEGMCVMHTCDNPACVNPAHLQLGTHLDNMRDMYAKGRRKAATGLNSGAGKLSDEQKQRIAAFIGPAWVMAAECGVSTVRVNQIRRAAASLSQGA